MKDAKYLDIGAELRRKADSDAVPKHYDWNMKITTVPLDNPEDMRGYENVSLIRLFNGYGGMSEKVKAEIAGMSLSSYSLLSTGRRAFSMRDISNVTTLASVILRCEHNKSFIAETESSLLRNILPEELKRYVYDPVAKLRKDRLEGLLIRLKKEKGISDEHAAEEAKKLLKAEDSLSGGFSPVTEPEKYAFLTEGKHLIPIIVRVTDEGVTEFKFWVKGKDRWETQYVQGLDSAKEMLRKGMKLRAKSKELGIKESAYKVGSQIKKLDTTINQLVSLNIYNEIIEELL